MSACCGTRIAAWDFAQSGGGRRTFPLRSIFLSHKSNIITLLLWDAMMTCPGEIACLLRVSRGGQWSHDDRRSPREPSGKIMVPTRDDRIERGMPDAPQPEHLSASPRAFTADGALRRLAARVAPVAGRGRVALEPAICASALEPRHPGSSGRPERSACAARSGRGSDVGERRRKGLGAGLFGQGYNAARREHPARCPSGGLCKRGGRPATLPVNARP